MSIHRPRVRIDFTNGLSFQDSPGEILGELTREYELIHDPVNPAVIVFGPYGNNVPQGNYLRVGYFCENFLPDMSACDYGFGIPYAEEINHPRYCRIDFHGFNPEQLVKPAGYADSVMAHHTHFCNFLYGNRVPYREEFFRELSRYKQVDAPGKSMRNMPPLSTDQEQNIWESKRNFIRRYKFTIAFENYTYPGYFTEKLLDPMLAGSMPVYLGNPDIGRHFNTGSFVNGRDFISDTRNPVSMKLEQWAQPDYQDWRPSVFNRPQDKIRRKLKIWGRQLKLKSEFRSGYKKLIEEIIRLDEDEQAYRRKLEEPWLIGNIPPDRSAFYNSWRNILNQAGAV